MTAVFWTSAPYPPSPTLRDQHTVVHGHHTPCVCTRYGAYAVRVGVEPSSAALALPDRHFPAGGLCSPLVTPTTFSSYSNNVVNQSASCIRVSSSRYSLARSSAFRCIAATLTVLTNFTSERVVRFCDVDAALASSRYALYRIFRTSRSASESASVPSPNWDAALVRLMR